MVRVKTLDSIAPGKPAEPPYVGAVHHPLRRVVIYSMNFAPELIGVGRYSGELASYLAAQGVKVDVIAAPPHYPGWSIRPPYTSNWYSVEREPGLRVTRCPIWLHVDMKGIPRLLAPLSFAMSSALVAVWRILTTRPDTVVVVEPTLFAAPAALLAAKLVGARTVLHVQDLEVDAAFAVGHLSGRGIRHFAEAIERRLLCAFDHIVTISRRMKDKLIVKGLQSANISIVRNWVHLDRIRPIPGANDYRSELNIDDDTFVVLYAGSIGAKQSLHLLLDAFERLISVEKLRFVVVGDGPEKKSLMSRGLPNVSFLPVQPEERLCELLNLADLHVLPQTKGAADLVLPSKLGGMLASGRPILVTAETGTELYDYLVGTAHLIPPDDSAEMAKCILELMYDRGDGSDAGVRGRSLAANLDARIALPEFAAILSGTIAMADLKNQDKIRAVPSPAGDVSNAVMQSRG